MEQAEFADQRLFYTNVAEIRTKITQPLSCFRQNVIYIMNCVHCGYQYVGKCGMSSKGPDGTCCGRTRIGEHGTRGRFKKRKNEDRLMFKCFAIKQVTRTDSADAQANNCTIHNGLNGTNDWNATGTFSKEVSKDIKALQFDEKDEVDTTPWKPPLMPRHVTNAQRIAAEAQSLSLSHTQLPLLRLVRLAEFPTATTVCCAGHNLTTLHAARAKPKTTLHDYWKAQSDEDESDEFEA